MLNKTPNMLRQLPGLAHDQNGRNIRNQSWMFSGDNTNLNSDMVSQADDYVNFSNQDTRIDDFKSKQNPFSQNQIQCLMNDSRSSMDQKRNNLNLIQN